MSNNELRNVANKYKKAFERYEIFPYEYIYRKKGYRMIHFFRLTSKLYGSYVYTPVDLEYEEVKKVFYDFILLDNYLKNKIKEHYDYAKHDAFKSYLEYKGLLEKILTNHNEFDSIRRVIGNVIEQIEKVEQYLNKITSNYENFQGIVRDIDTEKQFNPEQLKQIRYLYGQTSAFMFLQLSEQKKVIEECKKLRGFIEENQINKDSLIKELEEKTNIIINPKGELTLVNSMNKFGKVEELSRLSVDDLIEYQSNLHEKHFYEALNEDFIKRRVRNQSVPNS
jgi:hypothetical protein